MTDDDIKELAIAIFMMGLKDITRVEVSQKHMAESLENSWKLARAFAAAEITSKGTACQDK